MTVSELINKLLEFNLDSEVVILDSDSGGFYFPDISTCSDRTRIMLTCGEEPPEEAEAMARAIADIQMKNAPNCDAHTFTLRVSPR